MISHKEKQRDISRDLRSKGLSYREISNQLNISKSTIIRWCSGVKLTFKQIQQLRNNSICSLKKSSCEFQKRKRVCTQEQMDDLGITIPKLKELYWEKKYAVPQIARLFNVKDNYIYGLMRGYRIPRRRGAEVNYLTYKDKPQFKIRENLTREEEKLKVAGIMLYWAEGAKTRTSVIFSNSDPKMIQLFLKFLYNICGIDEKRLRVHLYAYSNQNLENIKIYWRRVTGIPFNQFNKPYIRESNLDLDGNRRKLLYGLVQIRYNDKKLLQTIALWIKEYLDNNDWAGTQAANGDRL